MNWQSLLKQAEATLAKAGVQSPAHDARALLAFHLGMPRSRLPLVLQDQADNAEPYMALIARRAAREPLAHITGTRGFWSLDLKVTPAVLDPRPDTETLIECVLAQVKDKNAPMRLLDIGTGSGAIALALLTELPGATAIATDVSTEALAIATENALATGLGGRISFVQTNWTDGLNGPFDVVVSNPPYIPSADVAGLEPEVRLHEPHLALDGGPDGLAPYRHILAALPGLCSAGALVAFEMGFDQADALAALMHTAGLEGLTMQRDLGGNARVVFGRFPG